MHQFMMSALVDERRATLLHDGERARRGRRARRAARTGRAARHPARA